MSVYDIVMAIIFFGAIWFGFRKGLAWQVASLLSIVLSYFVAVNFRNPVASLISAQAPWNQFAAMLLLFLGTSLVVWTIFASFSRNIKKMNMGGFDKQAGAILGGFKGAILAMLVTVFAVSLFQPTRDMVHNSYSGHWVVSGIRQFAQFTPTELAVYLEPHIQTFDQAIGATPERKPLFEPNANTNGGNFQANQNNGFQNNGFQNSPVSSSPNVFSNANVSNQSAPNYSTNQYGNSSASTQPQYQQQQPTSTGSGFGFNRPATTSNNQTPYSQNPVYNQSRTQPQTNTGGFYQAPNTGNQNSQFYQQQPAQNGYGQPQAQPTVTTGQNGWPQINTTINTKDLLNRGAETTAEMLRRAYESNVQSR